MYALLNFGFEHLRQAYCNTKSFVSYLFGHFLCCRTDVDRVVGPLRWVSLSAIALKYFQLFSKNTPHLYEEDPLVSDKVHMVLGNIPVG